MKDEKGLIVAYWHNLPIKQYEYYLAEGKVDGLLKTFLPYEFLKNVEWFRSFYKNNFREGESLEFSY